MYPTTIIGILYTIYTVLVLTLMACFAYALASPKKITLKFKLSLTGWITFLIVIAVAFHIITYLKLPWVKWELNSKKITPKREFSIGVDNYKFSLPENPIRIKANEPVKFSVSSGDVTYGFGVFRSDGTMLFQMQVVPGHINEIIWIFHKTGRYTIRSTEYSGPQNWKMVLKDAIFVEP